MQGLVVLLAKQPGAPEVSRCCCREGWASLLLSHPARWSGRCARGFEESLLAAGDVQHPELNCDRLIVIGDI